MAVSIGPVIVDRIAVPVIPADISKAINVTIAPILKPEPIPSSHLVISPYTDAPHLLKLDTVGIQEQLLAHALTGMESVIEDYALAPYTSIFNWAEVVEDLRRRAKAIGHIWKEQIFYIVVFRSQIPPTTDYSHLGDLDKAAHAEAVASGGFLKYWFGSPDTNGRNLATCVWRTRDDARKGLGGPAHRRAAGSARHSYTEWHIERLAFILKDNIDEWEISEWVDR